MAAARILPLIAIATAFGACGGEQAADDESQGGGVTVAALGDSITAGSPLWDPDPAVRAQIGNPIERSQFEYWASQADPRLEFRNCGVFGERVDQIAARLGDCADGADVLVVQGGINDIAQSLGRRRALARTPERAADGLDSIVRQGKAMDLRVVLVDVLPWNNGYPTSADAIVELNRRIHAIGLERNVSVIPFHDALEDPARPEQMRPDLTIDGDHPSIDGYRRLGELLARRLT
jgi:lysophospholipase L1-like esterase